MLSIAGDHVPVMLLIDVVGSVNEPPEQIAGIGSNVGVVGEELITTDNVAVEAHWPVAGVNVYVAVFRLSTGSGDQVPLMLLFDVVGSAGITSPEQYGPTGSNVGVVNEFTTTVNVAVVAHWPASGVKV